MNTLFLRELDSVRRLAGRFVENWRVSRNRGALRTRVQTHEGEPIADFYDSEHATYIARLHNLFPRLANETLELLRKLDDRKVKNGKDGFCSDC